MHVGGAEPRRERAAQRVERERVAVAIAIDELRCELRCREVIAEQLRDIGSVPILSFLRKHRPFTRCGSGRERYVQLPRPVPTRLSAGNVDASRRSPSYPAMARSNSLVVSFLATAFLACSSRGEVDSAADASVPLAKDDQVVVSGRGLRSFDASFSRHGDIKLGSAEWSATLRTTVFGRIGQHSAVAVGTRRAVGERIEYDHGKFVEWYQPTERGIEQGYTIASPPPGSGRIEIGIDVAGLQPIGHGETIALGTSAHVEGLTVFDARGRKLAAELHAAGGKVWIRADDTDATYPLTIDPLYTTYQGKLVGSDLAAGANLGRSTAVSGDTAVVGGAKQAWSGTGVAYVFTRSGTTWAQQAKILPSGLGANDAFGWSVAIDGETLAVGAPSHTGGGAVWVYTRSGTTWSLQQKLSATSTVGFGHSVSLVGDKLLIGAPWTSGNTGAAFVFTRSGTTWSETRRLTSGVAGEYYGHSVAIGDVFYVVGAPYNGTREFEAGAAYVYRATTFDLLGTRYPDVVKFGQMGYAVAARGNQLAVGAPSASAGRVYVWQNFPTYLGVTPSATLSGAYSFGMSLAYNDTMLAVGEPFFGFSDAAQAGRVHVYGRTGYGLDATLSLPDRKAGDEFSSGVGLTNDTMVVGGARRDEAGTDSGGAYVWRVITPKIIGGTCTVGAECISTFCVDGVCCDTACNTACQACTAARKGSGTDGTCGPVSSGGTPRTGECSGASCTSGTAYPAQVCNGAGACTAATGTSCGLYACSTTTPTCNTTCTTDAQCAAGAWCDAGVCKADLDNGTACARGTQCKSTFCTDGVCCDKACGGSCEACSTAKKGSGAEGACGPVAADSDPDNECAAATSDPCGLPGTCDGIGACRLYAKSGTACGATSCVDGKVTGKICNGAGACGDSSGISCGAFTCVGSACTTSCTDATVTVDCAATAYCTSTGTCAPKKANGLSCAAGKECTSSFCVDGVCCSSTCTGQCESCSETGTEGACVPVAGEPRGKRPKCSGDVAVCGGTCDGIDVTRCKYAPTSKDCGSKCETGTATENKCDGSGACVSTTKTCGLYGCDATACKTSCTVDTDCAAGNRCAAPTCVPTGGAKCIDNATSQTADGKTVACGAYKCDQTTGGCKQVCTDSVADCSAGNLCNPATKTCEPPATTGGTDDSGCGCETGPGRASSASGFAFLSLVAAAGVFGRRTNRRRR